MGFLNARDAGKGIKEHCAHRTDVSHRIADVHKFLHHDEPKLEQDGAIGEAAKAQKCTDAPKTLPLGAPKAAWSCH